ncbi:MAG: glycosyltransferase family 4 protein [Patescibacteria group bacterium]
MKIAIDYREAIRENKAGKGVVVWQLVDRLKKIILDDEVDLLVDEDFVFEDFPANWHKKIIGGKGLKWHWNVWRKLKNYDRYLSLTSFLVPAFDWNKKCIIFVHDLVVFYDELAKKHNRKAYWMERLTLGAALKKARKIIVPSETTGEDLKKFFKVDENNFSLVYEGVNIQNFQFPIFPSRDRTAAGNFQTYFDENIGEIKKKFGITGDYLFFVGTLEPRKNLSNLILAYDKLVKKYGWEGQLVLAGKKGWYFDELFTLVKKLNLEKKVIFTGFTTDEEKFILIKDAKCFCMVSRYEGFGLPILEAMSVGTPVVTSNNSSLSEVAGEAVVLVDPDNVEEIASGIQKVLSDKVLADSLVKKGMERIKLFDWEKAAGEVYNLVRD